MQDVANKFVFVKKRDVVEAEGVKGESIGFWRTAARSLFRDKLVMVAFIIMGLIVLLSLIIPLTGDPYVQNIHNNRQSPTWGHLFGTDQLGRDNWIRVWVGTRISLTIATILTSIEMLVGLIYGGISGYFGGRIDNYMQRLIEIFSNIPFIVVATILMLIFSQSFSTLILSLAMFCWIGLSRLVRAQTLKYKEFEFVLASRTLGAGGFRLIANHCLPNMLSTFIIVLTFSFPGFILSEAFLSVLSLGLPVGDISLGLLIVDNISELQTNPHLLFIPLSILLLITLSFNVIGNGLRDALDPKLKDM